MNVIVSDTSPLRALAQLDLLDVPSRLFDSLIIPSAVASELSVAVPGLPNVDPLTVPGARVQTPADIEPLPSLRARLGDGEAEAIALALQLNATAILIDEAPGRRIAVQFGLDPLGTLGLLGRAKRAGLVGAVAPLIDRLEREIDFRVAEAVRQAALRLAGE